MSVVYFRFYQREEGPGQMSEIFAHSRPVVEAVRDKAEALGARAQSNLDTRAVRRTGDSNIVVRHKGDDVGGVRSKLDSYVFLADPTDEWAAVGIEFGWSRARENMEGDHASYGADGLHVLSDAIGWAVRKGAAEL